MKQLNLLKKTNRHLKVLLSIGGWTYSANFKGPAATPEGRQTFANSCTDLLKTLGFDGIDIDWEYPQTPEEAKNFVELLGTLRQALDEYSARCANGYHFEITVACPAGPDNFKKLEVAGMDKYLDAWHLMAYDYAGSWDQVSGHQANLYPSKDAPTSTPFSTVAAVDFYTQNGVAPNKLVLGMPLYGRAFENTEGLGKPFQGVGQGTWEAGVHDYKKLPLESSQEQCDQQCGASYCYNAGKKVLVTYDTPEVARIKTAFIRQRGLGGGMWWESSADKPGGDSLIQITVDGLGGTGALSKSENCLSFPETKYDNLRDGFPNN